MYNKKIIYPRMVPNYLLVICSNLLAMMEGNGIAWRTILVVIG